MMPFAFTYVATILVAILITILIVKYNWNRRKLYALSNKLDGRLALPLIGNSYVFLGSAHSKLIYDNCILKKKL